MPSPQRTIFRQQALEYFTRKREEDILPRLVTPPAFLLLWLLLGFIIIAGFFVWNISLPITLVEPGVVQANQTTHQMQALFFLTPNQLGQIHSNLHFQGIKNPCVLPFADATFDVIHIQQCASLFPPRHWPHLLTEVARLLKPGGWLNLVDFEMGFVSEPTLNWVLTLLRQMLDKMGWNPTLGGTFPVTGSALGPYRMAQQGFTEIDYQLSPIDLGRWNNLAGRAYLVQCVIRPAFLMALVERTGIGTKEEMQVLVREAQRELRHVSFCGAGMLLSSFARKPFLPVPDAGHSPHPPER